MRGFSKAIIAGNLTRDPEMRTTPSGASVCSFSVAVNRRFRTASGENQESTSFIDCTAWGRTGETISQYMHKGSPILVSGRLDQRSWDDKNTGQKRSRVEIVVEDFNFIGGEQRDGGGSYGGGNAASSNAAPAASDVAPADIPDEEIDISDIPF